MNTSESKKDCSRAIIIRWMPENTIITEITDPPINTKSRILVFSGAALFSGNVDMELNSRTMQPTFLHPHTKCTKICLHRFPRFQTSEMKYIHEISCIDLVTHNWQNKSQHTSSESTVKQNVSISICLNAKCLFTQEDNILLDFDAGARLLILHLIPNFS